MYNVYTRVWVTFTPERLADLCSPRCIFEKLGLCAASSSRGIERSERVASLARCFGLMGNCVFYFMRLHPSGVFSSVDFEGFVVGCSLFRNCSSCLVVQ